MNIEYDYFRVVAEYDDAETEIWVMRQPSWCMKPSKDNWEVHEITKEEYNTVLYPWAKWETEGE